jgi:hypothetical protein
MSHSSPHPMTHTIQCVMSKQHRWRLFRCLYCRSCFRSASIQCCRQTLGHRALRWRKPCLSLLRKVPSRLCYEGDLYQQKPRPQLVLRPFDYQQSSHRRPHFVDASTTVITAKIAYRSTLFCSWHFPQRQPKSPRQLRLHSKSAFPVQRIIRLVSRTSTCEDNTAT